MDIQPASIDQVRIASDGGMVTITADVGGVAADIQRIDPCLKLKRSKSTGIYVVYRLHRNGEPCRDDDPERTEELVLTARECDQRIVSRLEFIDSQGRGGYDYADALERARRDREARERAVFHERIGGTAELAAHELRKATGDRYQGRIFLPRSV
jgi:hypothetical protein